MQRLGLVSLGALLLCAMILLAQTAAATLEGIIQDQSGAAISGARVEILDANNKVIASTTSDVSGVYRFAALPAGKYRLRATSSGFHTLTQEISLRAGAKLIRNLELKVGSTLESVEVTTGIVSRADRFSRRDGTVHGVIGGVPGGAPTPRVPGYHPMPAPEDREDYAHIAENRFLSPSVSPLSTFSIDVDTASYANMRRFLRDGARPPKDAIRTEELVNYFHYSYPEPDGEHPVSITTELALCPWQPQHKLARIGLKAKSIDVAKLPPANLVFLLDVSGSMSSLNKLPLLQKAFSLLVEQLRPQDEVSIVVYAGAAGTVLKPTSGKEKNRILEAINQLRAGGSTAGAQGIQLAYNTARANFKPNGNNRVILATDGDFNVGVSTESELIRLIEAERKSGIYLTLLGFGTGNLQDSKMEALAKHGNGNYAYVDSLLEARKVLVQEMGATLLTLAKDVKLQIEFNPAQVKAYRLIGYENRLLNAEDFNDDKKDAGEMGAGHTVTALYEIVPVGVEGTVPSVDELKYQKTQATAKGNSSELLTVKLRYKDPKQETSRLLSQPLNDSQVSMAAASADLRFAAAVVEFSMLLRDSEFKASASFDQVVELAGNSLGPDPNGHRAEFLYLVKSARNLGPSE